MTRPRGCPTERLLGEPDGVLQIEPADIGPPGQVQVELARAGPPQPQHLGGRVRAGTRWTWTRRMVPRTIGRGPRVLWPGWRCCLGCSPLQACTVTAPYWSS